jgi:hypothetical protein
MTLSWRYSSGFSSGAWGGGHSTLISRSVARYSFTTRAMGLRSVPNLYQQLSEAGSHVAQHSHHLRPTSRLAVMTLINPPVHSERGDCRELSPLALTPQDRRSPGRAPDALGN